MDFDFKPVNRPAKSLQSSPATPDTQTQTPPKESSFQTPEAVAANDNVSRTVDLPAGNGKPTAAKPPASDGGWRSKLKLDWPPGRKEYIAAAVLVLLLGAGSFLLAARHTDEPVPVAKVTKKAVLPPKPTTIASNLTGLQVDPTVNQKVVTGIMIENSTDSRPQSGLSEAGVVFEAIAEGGITRFLALYLDNAPADIGPVRSARPYYAQWALGFDAGYAHVGGSPEALANIKTWGVRDLDQFANSGSYRRISSRAAPHNVYTSMAALHQLEAAKGYTGSKFTSLVRKPKEEPLATPTAKAIDIRISGPVYNTHYDYDAAANNYKRSEGGAAHIDANTNAQLTPKVVVALVIPYSLAADGHHSVYNTIGSGPVYIFQDGGYKTGTWSKTGNNGQFSFTDAAGKPIGLNPGQTWVTAVSDSGKVTYVP